MDYIIKPYLPANQVHILGGSPGVGKTTILFQILAHLNLPTAYITCDRTLDSYDQTLDRTSRPSNFHTYSIIDQIASDMQDRQPSRSGSWLSWATAWLTSLPSRPSIVVFDPALTALPDVRNFNDTQQVASAMARLAAWAKTHSFTCILIFHTNKTKKQDDFMNIFHRISGSAAIGGYASTRALLTSVDEHDEGPCLFLQGQHYPDTRLRLARGEQGLFSLMNNEDAQAETLVVLDLLPAAVGEAIHIKDVVKIASQRDLSRATVYRQLDRLTEKGLVRSCGAGWWMRAVCDASSTLALS